MDASDATVPAAPGGEAAESLALGALDWLLGSASSAEAGLTWAAVVPGAEASMSLYHGSAGIVLALLEAWRHFGDDRYGDAALRGAAAIAATAGHEEDCSLYFGLAGLAVALEAVHDQRRSRTSPLPTRRPAGSAGRSGPVPRVPITSRTAPSASPVPSRPLAQPPGGATSSTLPCGEPPIRRPSPGPGGSPPPRLLTSARCRASRPHRAAP